MSLAVVSLSTSIFVLVVLTCLFVGSLIGLIIFFLRFKPQFDEIGGQKEVIAFLHKEVIDLSKKEENHKEQLLQQKEQISHLRQQVESLTGYVEVKNKQTGQPYSLLAVIGSDSATRDDLVALRQAGVDIVISHPPTLVSFEKRLNNLRATGRMPRGIHFALHAGSEGIEFEDQTATLDWLSDNLADIEIIVVAGCRGSDIGFHLASRKQRVITIQNDVEAGHAALLTRVFWEQVSLGSDAVQAFADARKRLPPHVSELLELH